MIIYYVNDIPIDLVDKVEEYILSADVPWCYQTFTIGEEEKKLQKPFLSKELIVNDHPIFHSLMYWAGKRYDSMNVVSNLSDYLIEYFGQNLIQEELNLGRVLANMTLPIKSAEGTIQQPHTDCAIGEPFYSFLYYPTDSDGDTYFFDDNHETIAKASPLKGTGVLFNSDITHAGSLPIYNERRIAINFMFERLKYFKE
jgi:hypothetical protein